MKDWATLVRRAQNGDGNAFGALVEQFQSMAVGYAYSILLDFEQAQDVAQEAFLQSYLHLRKLQEPQAFPAWFRRVIFTQCTRYLRGKRFATVSLDSVVTVATKDATPEELTFHSTVRDAVRQLPESERAITLLFYLGGYSHAEVGVMLDLPVSTVKSRLYSARLRLRERMAVMEQTLTQNAPGETFRQKVLNRVQKLSWETSGDCTFGGALVSATAVTPYPQDYQTILGVTGLAFRTRWFQGPPEIQRWCPSSPCGEFPEECEAARQATGWKLRYEKAEGQGEELTPQIKSSIDKGLPILAFDEQKNIGVICGYEDDGRTVLMNTYFSKGENLRQPIANLPMFVMFLDEHTDPLTRRDAALQGITMGVNNFHRRHDPADDETKGYWHGSEAFVHWAEDIGLYDTLTEGEQGFLFFVSWWNFTSLADCRRHAGPFLRQTIPLVRQATRAGLERAAALYEREADLLARTYVQKDVFLGHWTGKTLNDWTAEVRENERKLLMEARDIEAEAIEILQAALAQETAL